MEKYNEWSFARKLMEAFDISLYLNNKDICNKIEGIINSLNLPTKVCESCKKVKMSAFVYILCQGMCNACSDKYSKLAEKEIEDARRDPTLRKIEETIK